MWALPQCHKQFFFLLRILFSENLWSSVKCAVVCVQSDIEGNILQYSDLVECFFSSLQRDGIPKLIPPFKSFMFALPVHTTYILRHFSAAKTDYTISAAPYSQSLPRPTHKRQSPVRAWKRVHSSRCYAGHNRRGSAAAGLQGLRV